MKNFKNLKAICGGAYDPNIYNYTQNGQLLSTRIGWDGTFEGWSGPLYAADGSLIADGQRTVFDPTRPGFDPRATVQNNNRKGGNKGK